MMRSALDWLNRPMDRKKLLRFCLLFGLAAGLLAHGFMFVNKLPNHDDLNHYYSFNHNGIDVGLPLGRYFLEFFWKAFGGFSTPWINGIFSVLFLGAAAFCLCDAMDWREGWQAGAAVLLLELCPNNISIFCYMFESHVKTMAVLWACLAPWLMKRGGRLRWVLAALACWVATGIYQSNLMVAIAMLLLYVIRFTLDAEDGKTAWREAVLCATAAVAGLVLYLAVFKALVAVSGVTVGGYQGMSEMGSLTFGLIPQKIQQAYRTWWEEYLVKPPAYVNGRMAIFRAALTVFGMGGLLGCAVWRFGKKRIGQGALLLICAALLPLAGSGVLFMGDDIDAHMITMYPMVWALMVPLCWLRPALPDKAKLRRLAAMGFTVLYMGHAFFGFAMCNQAYMRLYHAFTRAEHFMNRVAMRIEALDGYRPGVPLTTWGYLDHEDSLLFYEYDIVSRFLPFTGLRVEIDYVWPYCSVNFMNAVIGLPVSNGEGWRPATEEGWAQIAAMPCYPVEGSVAMVEDVCVVKFSEWPAGEELPKGADQR